MKKIILLSAAMLLVGCEPTAPAMSSVMNSCETKNFSVFNNCIQKTYTRNPDGGSVRSLYAQLNAIEEDQRRGKITQTKAKALAYKAYDATVGAGNRSNRQAAFDSFQNYADSYVADENRRIDEFNSRQRTTNCRAFGSQINCVSR